MKITNTIIFDEKYEEYPPPKQVLTKKLVKSIDMASILTTASKSDIENTYIVLPCI